MESRSVRVIVEIMSELDVADVLAVESASFGPRSEPKNVGATTSRDGARLDEAKLAEELARPWARIWVARGDVGGHARAVSFLLAWHVADELHVLDVATHPEFRRRGFGMSLMQQALTYAREKDIRHLLLEVRRSNASAIRLYRSCGFFAMGVRKGYYADGEDAVEMVLELDDSGEVVRRQDEIGV